MLWLIGADMQPDRDRVVRVEDWSICGSEQIGHANCNQECGCTSMHRRIQGNFFGHPDVLDGSEAVSGRIVDCNEEQGILFSKHTAYTLGRIDPCFLKWMRESAPVDDRSPNASADAIASLFFYWVKQLRRKGRKPKKARKSS